MAETAATPAAETAAPAQEQQQTQHENGQQHAEQSENIETLIQRAVDRATNKIGNENKKLRADLEAERKKNLSESEIKDLELQEKQKTLEDRAKALTEKENRWFAMKAIKEAGLDDGGADSMAIVDFVMDENEEKITQRVKAFDTLVKGIVQKKVDAVFKANGRTPGVGSDTAAAAGGKNENVAVLMGKKAAATNQESRSILDKYIGGK